MNDLDGLGLTLHRVGFIDLHPGIKSLIYPERKCSLMGFAWPYLLWDCFEDTDWTPPLSPSEISQGSLSDLSVRKSCFWDCSNLIDFVSLVTGGFPSSLWLIGSSEPNFQSTFEHISGYHPLGSLYCLFQACFLSDLFLSYCILSIFVSCFQSFLEQSRVKTKQKKIQQSPVALAGMFFVFVFFKDRYYFILLIFGCVGSLLLCAGFL